MRAIDWILITAVIVWTVTVLYQASSGAPF